LACGSSAATAATGITRKIYGISAAITLTSDSG
jgi:hypothetical protein